MDGRDMDSGQSATGHWRARLMDDRQRLGRQLGMLRDDVGARGIDETLPTYEGFGQHASDQGSDMLEREMDRAVELDFRAQLQEIDDALGRLDDGSFGRCAVCTRPIGDERLDALPWTRWCIDHQAAAERADSRVLDPSVPVRFLDDAPSIEDEDDVAERPDAQDEAPAEEAAMHLDRER